MDPDGSSPLPDLCWRSGLRACLRPNHPLPGSVCGCSNAASQELECRRSPANERRFVLNGSIKNAGRLMVFIRI